MQDKVVKLIVGSRGSDLALAQCELLKKAICDRNQAVRIDYSVREFVTSGDLKRDSQAFTPRDKVDWVAEIQEALLSGEINVALHSGKDVPVSVAEQTRLIPVLSRAKANDVLIVSPELAESVFSVAQLPKSAKIGTSSKRRAAQIRLLRPDCEIVPLRGNVPTRISKLYKTDEYDAIVIAAAGVNRLGIELAGIIELPFEQVIPGVNQGILLAQIRREESQVLTLLEESSEQETLRASLAEREVVRALDADCDSALGVYATVNPNSGITLAAQVLSHDGTQNCRVEKTATQGENDSSVVAKVIDELIGAGAIEILKENSTN